MNNIKLLRNLCRMLGLPTVLASTSARVNNLLNVGSASALKENYIWVNAIRTLPQANMKAIIHILDWDKYSNEKCELDLKMILEALKINYQPCYFSRLQNLLLIMGQQSKTCLQGVAVYVHSAFKDGLLKQSGNQLDVVAIWEQIVHFLHDKLEKRKPAAFRNDGPFHSLAMISNFRVISDNNLRKLDNSNRPVPTAEIVLGTINSHYYYFGNVDDPIVIPFINNAGRLKCDSHPYNNCSNFNLFKDDMFLCMAIWYNICSESVVSVASIMDRYINTLSKAFKNWNALRNDSGSQECMVYWALCNSSHKAIHSLIPCPLFLNTFIENVQVDQESLRIIRENNESETIDSLPKLEAFLARIKIPYLVPAEIISSEIISKLDGLCKFGNCTRLSNKSGLDIGFELFLDDIVRKGFVECKYHDKSLSDLEAKKYINKAKANLSPFSMLLTYSLNDELKTINYFNSQKRQPGRQKKAKANQIEGISVYSIYHTSEQLKIVPLIEYDNPEGVFIIIQTNFCIPKV
jgi:hypothetical protein